VGEGLIHSTEHVGDSYYIRGTVVRAGVKAGYKNYTIRFPLPPLLQRASNLPRQRTCALQGQVNKCYDRI